MTPLTEILANGKDHSTPVKRDAVVIVGAGPTGLTAACELLRRGVPVRLLDGRPEASGHSKALLLWPRSMDVLAQMGLAREAARRAIPVRRFSYYSSRRRVARIRFEDSMLPLCLPQRATEEVLTERLHLLGGKVERGFRVAALRQHEESVEMKTVYPDGIARTMEADWVIGADGAHSTIRDCLGIRFQGATYPNTFMLADAFGGEHLPRDEAHYFQSPGQILVVVPLPDGRHRYFVNAPSNAQEATLELMQDLVSQRGPGGITLRDPEWLSTFQVHHKVVDLMSEGRCFLAGDAAHIHSPAGGQGLNTGIQDAYNLAWKLAAVVTGRARRTLLNTYQVERLHVARQVVRDTDIQTRAWLVSAPWKVRIRDVLLRAADGSGLLQRYAPVMAGKRVAYPLSPAVLTGRHGGAGTAFPQALLAERDQNPLRYQLVTVGLPHEASAALHGVLRHWRHLLDHTAISGTVSPLGGKRLLCRKPGFYLVRPDGYIAQHGHAGDLDSADRALAALHTPHSPSHPCVELGVEPLVCEPGVTSWLERIPQGETRPLHTHTLPWLTIVVAGGIAEVLGPDGSSREEITLTTGQVKFNPLPTGGEVRHALRNTGKTDLILAAVQVWPGGAQ